MGATPSSHNKTWTFDNINKELPDIYFSQPPLSDGWFLKTAKCVYKDGPIVVKVFPFAQQVSAENLDILENRLTEIKKLLNNEECFNVCPFQKFIETNQNLYLIRQYFFNNLRDRVETRPRLQQTEKIWIVYLLLKALDETHSRGVCHGDIKLENVMLTSWNWVYLTDFASYKSIFIPDNAPSEFSYFFDTTGTRNCYLAPERFKNTEEMEEIKKNKQENANYYKLTPAMDIFSLGCLIAELFSDGPLFTLGDLISYKKGEFDADSKINQSISQSSVRRMVRTMISINPEKRGSASFYLRHWCDALRLPAYFPMLYTKTIELMKLDPDEKILAIKSNYSSFQKEFTQRTNSTNSNTDTLDPKSSANRILKQSEDPDFALSPKPQNRSGSSSNQQQIHNNNNNPLYGTHEDDDGHILHHHHDDFSNSVIPKKLDSYTKIKSFRDTESFILLDKSRLLSGDQLHQTTGAGIGDNSSVFLSTSQLAASSYFVEHKPAQPSPASNIDQLKTKTYPGMVNLLSIVCSCIHNVISDSIKLDAIELFVRFSEDLDDNCRYQRIIPYLISLFHNQSGVIQSAAVIALTKVLQMVYTFPPSDIKIFPEYILPALTLLLHSNSKQSETSTFTAPSTPSSSQRENTRNNHHSEPLNGNDTRNTKTHLNNNVVQLGPAPVVLCSVAYHLSTLAEISNLFISAEEFLSESTYLSAMVPNDESTTGSNASPSSNNFNNLFSSSTDAGENSNSCFMNDESGILSGDLPLFENGHFENIIRELAKPRNNIALDHDIRCSLLTNFRTLSHSFSSERGNNFLISILLDFLRTGPTWQVRSLALSNLPCLVQGCVPSIIPFVIQYLYDPEENLVIAALRCFMETCEFIPKRFLLFIIETICSLLLHPSISIRKHVVSALCILCDTQKTELEDGDLWTFAIPLISKFTTVKHLGTFVPDYLFSILIDPIPWSSYNRLFSYCRSLISFGKSSTSSNNHTPLANTTSGILNKQQQQQQQQRAPGTPTPTSAPQLTQPHKNHHMEHQNLGGFHASNLFEDSLLLSSMCAPTDEPNLSDPSSYYYHNVLHQKGYFIPFGDFSNFDFYKDQIFEVQDLIMKFLNGVGKEYISTNDRENIFTMRAYISCSITAYPNDKSLDAIYFPRLYEYNETLFPIEYSSFLFHEIKHSLRHSDEFFSLHSPSPNHPIAYEFDFYQFNPQKASSSPFANNNNNLYHSTPTSHKNNPRFQIRENNKDSFQNIIPSNDQHSHLDKENQFQLYSGLFCSIGNKKGENRSISSSWVPKGQYIHSLYEHTLPIHCLAVSSDGNYFLSGSHDRCVKFWDGKSIGISDQKSTFSTPFESGVTSVCISNVTNGFLTGEQNGKISFIRLDGCLDENISLSPISSYSLPSSIVDICNIQLSSYGGAVGNNDHPFTYLCTSSNGEFIGIDLRERKPFFQRHIDSLFGTISSVLYNSQQQWCIFGTSRGVYSCWDFRIQTEIKSWIHPTKKSSSPSPSPGGCSSRSRRIHSMCFDPTCNYDIGGDPNFFASVGDEIFRWNAGSSIYDKVYHKVDKNQLWQKPDLNGSFVSPMEYFNSSSLSQCSFSSSSSPSCEFHSLFSFPGSNFFLSGAEDCCIRAWDINRPKDSKLLCGWNAPGYSSAYDFKEYDLHIGESSRKLCLVEEYVHENTLSSCDNLKNTPKATTGHKDAILDISAINYAGTEYLLSASRDGEIKIWR